ncbi:MAG: helix-turn-helix domain-containing protein [Bacilli bacterium]
MKELGEYLQLHRKENGVSIDEVSEDLQIDKDLLESLEEGNIRAFRDVYTLKDYVRSYAKYLGLDPEKVLDE